MASRPQELHAASGAVAQAAQVAFRVLQGLTARPRPQVRGFVFEVETGKLREVK